MTKREHDQETFEAGLRIVRSARDRGIEPSLVWQMLRAAMPEEYRCSEDEMLTRQKQREERDMRLGYSNRDMRLGYNQGKQQLSEGFCQDDFLSAGRGGVPTFRPGGD